MFQPRKMARFKLGPQFPLTANIRQTTGKIHRLVTLSEGGFGFYGSPKDAKIVQLDEVQISFRLADRSYDVSGNVRYCSIIKDKTGPVTFFGVRFNNPDSKLQMILRSLIQSGLKKGHLNQL